jgi:FlaA1/EpsC-like NDP-sugar epimerase
VKRYFIVPEESGQLCLMSCIFGHNGDIFFPKLEGDLHLITFQEIAERYLRELGYEPYHTTTEEEAREAIQTLGGTQKWPCLFTASDTTGEKDFEEFFTENEQLDLLTYQGFGVVKNNVAVDLRLLDQFAEAITQMSTSKQWSKASIVAWFEKLLPDFNHLEKGKYLDSKM